jgi:hypothetical protein
MRGSLMSIVHRHGVRSVTCFAVGRRFSHQIPLSRVVSRRLNKERSGEAERELLRHSALALFSIEPQLMRFALCR